MSEGRAWQGRAPAMAVAIVAAAVWALLPAPSPAVAAPPTPFGHDCSPENGVLFCPTVDLADRVPSFDGAPLDVDVTLPAGTEAGEPLPTIVMMHGYGGSKTDYEASSPEGDSDSSETTYHWNNNFFAKQGYAVVNYTARGFGRSCGRAENSNATPECLSTRSYIHLADQRWEARDTQHLLGLLADEEVTIGDRTGVTGISYGGGQSLELAYLRDRIRNEDGSFSPWTSPEGEPMEIAAAFPRWLWSDLAAALVPNGRFRDDRISDQTESVQPVGIPILSYVSGLFALGSTVGTYCGAPPRTPPCDDPSADLTMAFTEVLAGEPLSPQGVAFLEELREFHSGYGLADEGGEPAPLLLQSGWTDDLFPAEHSIRVYNALRDADPGSEVTMQLGDLGHARASNKEASDRAFNDEGAAFFARWLMDEPSAAAPEAGGITAYTQTCPQDARTDGPFTAGRYERLAPGSLSFERGGEQTVTSVGGDPAIGLAVDPIAGGGNACRQVPAEDAPGTAVIKGPTSRGYTLLGLPTVRATVATTGNFGQLDSRLWDLAPDGQQTLVTRGAYRLRNNQQGRVTLQLNGNGYCFADGHVPRLELLGTDAPRLRPSNGAFSIDVSDVSVELPTAERDPTPRLRVEVRPGRTESGERRRFRIEVSSREAECATSSDEQPARGVPVARAEVRFAGRTIETDGRGRASVRARLSGAGIRLARASKEGYRDGRDRVRVRAADGDGDGNGPGDDGEGGGDDGDDGDAGSGAGTDSGATGSDDAGLSGALPFTGLTLAALVLAGLALTLGGMALRRWAARRRLEHP